MESKIRKIMKKFNFKGQSGALLHWKCIQGGHGWVLTVADQPFLSTQDQQGHENYWRRCLGYGNVGPDTWVQYDCFAGQAAQARVPQQRTKHDDTRCLGQLAVPVFQFTDNKEILVGVIELVTYLPKENYVPPVNQINKLLMGENLTTTKTIKVDYMDNTIKFLLPLSSGISNLWGEVTQRFQGVGTGAFQLKYLDYKGNSLPILSDGDLRACIADPTSMGTMTIRMFIE